MDKVLQFVLYILSLTKPQKLLLNTLNKKKELLSMGMGFFPTETPKLKLVIKFWQ